MRAHVRAQHWHWETTGRVASLREFTNNAFNHHHGIQSQERFGPDDPLKIKPAHDPVWNPPDRPHMTKVGPEPFLCLYCWTHDIWAGAEVVPATDWADLEKLNVMEVA